MTSGEIFKHVYRGGALVVLVEGTRTVVMRRKVPRTMKLKCQRCGSTWGVTTTAKGGCPRGYRKCPRGCNLARLRAEQGRS